MSHAPERTEKNCLNCGTTVQGRYCHICGQENTVPKESFWSLVIHFFYDITHFDSKFFDTLRYLLFKPGYLSSRFMMGKRASFLNPVRMYVFTSAFFFIVFFTFFKSDSAIKWDDTVVLTQDDRDSILKTVEEKLSKTPNDEFLLKQANLLKDTSKPVRSMDFLELSEDFRALSVTGNNYKSLEEYDSAQKKLPPGERDGWFSQQIQKKEIEINSRYRYRPKQALKDVADAVLHKLPYLLFVSLPLFAFVLKLLYFRHKEYYYADHAIFSVHHYIFSFINLLFIMGFSKLEDITGWGIFSIGAILLVLLWFFYLYKGMRNFYHQRRGKTILKYLLLNLSALVINIILMALFFFLSIFTI
ncbi:MAG: DUF3667 domain-containing protein [Chitinophagaceae bacterium]|nr:DUF3667 domain-containing protein [Chitinophagaceae bacterium]